MREGNAQYSIAVLNTIRRNKSTLYNALPCYIIISRAPLINDDIVDVVTGIIIIIVTTFLINEKIEILGFPL